MVILGLGSNLNDRLDNLRRALALIREIPQLSVEQVSPVYMSDALMTEDAPESWNVPYLNLALRCETSLAPYELLRHVKAIEVKVGRVPGAKWGPRIIDIDLLAWDDLIQYDEKLHIPHENLHERPFALWPLADIAPRWVYPLPGVNHGKTASEMIIPWGSRFSGDAPLHTKQIQQRIDTPQLVGIVNITPDSFSGSELTQDSSSIIQRVQHLVEAGAEIIDIGAEATGPKAQPIDARLEWQRLEPILVPLLSELERMVIKPKISIDTRHAETAKKVLGFGIDWINDVTGLTDPAMQEIVAASSCDIVVMHNLGVPVTEEVLAREKDPVSLVNQWAENHFSLLEKKGITRNRIIFDVGIGYGKTAEQSLELLKHIDRFRELDLRLLVGHSRKSFLQQFTAKLPVERDIETMVLSLFLAKKHVDYLRVHNVEFQSSAFKVTKAMVDI